MPIFIATRKAAAALRTLPDNLLDALRALESNMILREGTWRRSPIRSSSSNVPKGAITRNLCSPWERQHTLDC